MDWKGKEEKGGEGKKRRKRRKVEFPTSSVLH